MEIKEVRDELKEAYRRQNKVYNDWEKKLVGPVPEFLHTPELLNSELIHSVVKSVDYLLAQAEQEEKTKVALATKMRELATKLDELDEKLNLGGG